MLTIVAVADDDQVTSLTVGVERTVAVTRERAMFQIISEMCISSCDGCQQKGHQPLLKSGAVANVKSTVAMELHEVTHHVLWICLVGYSQCRR